MKQHKLNDSLTVIFINAIVLLSIVNIYMIVKCGIIYIYPTKILRVLDVGEISWKILKCFIINEVKFIIYIML